MQKVLLIWIWIRKSVLFFIPDSKRGRRVALVGPRGNLALDIFGSNIQLLKCQPVIQRKIIWLAENKEYRQHPLPLLNSIVYLLARHVPFIAEGAVRILHCTERYGNMSNSVRHFLGEQLSHGEFYKNLVDCILSHTILKISCKNSV